MEDDKTYTVYRSYFDCPEHDREVVLEGLTKQEAMDHCNDEDTSWDTCTTEEGQARTAQHGKWFDMWMED